LSKKNKKTPPDEGQKNRVWVRVRDLSNKIRPITKEIREEQGENFVGEKKRGVMKKSGKIPSRAFEMPHNAPGSRGKQRNQDQKGQKKKKKKGGAKKPTRLQTKRGGRSGTFSKRRAEVVNLPQDRAKK